MTSYRMFGVCAVFCAALLTPPLDVETDASDEIELEIPNDPECDPYCNFPLQQCMLNSVQLPGCVAGQGICVNTNGVWANSCGGEGGGCQMRQLTVKQGVGAEENGICFEGTCMGGVFNAGINWIVKGPSC